MEQKSICRFDEKNEIWKVVREFPWLLISSYGRLKNVRTNKIFKGKYGKVGYIEYCIYSKADKKHYFRYAHRLVAEQFLPEPEDPDFVCDHIDRDILNNHVSNLRWVSRQDNRNNCKEIINDRIDCYNTPINLYDKQGNFIKDFNSIVEASKEMKRRRYEITSNIHKRRAPFNFGYFELKNLKN